MDGQRAAHELVAAAAALGVTVVAGEPMAGHTTFRIGGPADLYTTAATPKIMLGLVELAREMGVPVMVLGGGSNVLVSDAGIRGLVIGNGCRDIRQEATPDGNSLVIAGSGVPLAGLSRWTIRERLTGLEWAVSVPGTVGGAVIGNAGAHGSDIAGCLAWVRVAYAGQGSQVVLPAALRYAYRSSALKELLANSNYHDGTMPVVIEAGFRLAPGDPDRIAAAADAFLAHRRATQPVEPSAGSVFRNPPGDYAGRLVDAVGLKGHRIGGAQISSRHANFIINVGEARAADVAALMALIRSRVHSQFGIELVPEIVLVGEWEA